MKLAAAEDKETELPQPRPSNSSHGHNALLATRSSVQSTAILSRGVMKHAHRAAVAATALLVPALLLALPVVLRGRAPAGAMKVHTVEIGVHDNRLTVEGDGDTDLDCWVYGPDGQKVDSDTDTTDYCILDTPGIGTHRLYIKNLGSVYNDYVVRRER